MGVVFRLIGKTDPKLLLETRQARFLVGRALECDLVIPERHVSRVQARVSYENGRHYVKNIGRNPLRINGRASRGDFLKAGDEISFGTIDYLYQVGPSVGAPDSEAQTQLAVEPAAAAADRRRRVVCTRADGSSATHPLTGTRAVIGRSQEADIVLVDPAVSRRHCVIEQRDGGVHARNISAGNPLLLNGRPTIECRLYTGDRLAVGGWTVTFLSGRPEDARPSGGLRRRRMFRWGVGLTVALAAAYAAQAFVFVPWTHRRELAHASSELEAGAYEAARGRLLLLLSRGPAAEESAAARRFLNEAALGAAADRGRRFGPEDAAGFLKAHLAEHGSTGEAAAVWDRLNQYRIEIGRRLEPSEPQRALGAYAAVPEDSPHFAEAQTAIHRLWQNYQKRSFQQQTVAQLLREAEAHYAAGRLLTPVHRNAYSAYRAVLAIEPHHETALRRIDQIRQHYRNEGEAQFRAENWDKALPFLEAYILLEPDALDVRAKIARCHQRLAAPVEPGPRPQPAAAAGHGEEQERVRRLLKESGAEGSWIMKYLFEEKPVEAESDSPW